MRKVTLVNSLAKVTLYVLFKIKMPFTQIHVAAYEFEEVAGYNKL